MESALFIELSEEQQQLIAAGGPTTTDVNEDAVYNATTAINAAFSSSTVFAGPDGAGATGTAFASELENAVNATSDQNSFGASGYVPEL